MDQAPANPLFIQKEISLCWEEKKMGMWVYRAPEIWALLLDSIFFGDYKTPGAFITLIKYISVNRF